MFKKVNPNFRECSTGSDVGCLTSVVKTVVDGSVKKSVVVSGSSSELVPDLPAPQNFSLQNQIEAGVRMEYVPSNILEPDTSNINEFVESKKSISDETSEN